MKHPILRSSIHEISEDTKFIRLATVTTFVHSLLFVLYLIYLGFSIVSLAQGSDNQLLLLLQEYIQTIQANTTLIVIFIILCVIGVIGYALLPPIGEAAMIYYLDSEHKGGTVSLGKGVNKFFPMFEFNAAVSLFNIFVFLIAVSRMRAMGIITQPLVMTVVIIWMVMIIVISLLFPYTRILITLENFGFRDAMKESMELSLKNFSITLRFVAINYLLYIRFIVNLLILVGVPLLLIYVAVYFQIAQLIGIQTLLVVILIGLILLTAYIEGIIEAFFLTYRYKVYQHITHHPPGSSSTSTASLSGSPEVRETDT